MKVFYFTATGNNLYLAKRTEAELYSIPQALKEGPKEYHAEAIGLIFPCYYFGLPGIVSDFLENTTLKTDYLYAIMSYGSYSFGTEAILRQAVKQKGMQLSYFNRVCMVDNYLPLFDTQKQLKIKSTEGIEEKIECILKDIKSRKTNSGASNPLAMLTSRLARHYYQARLKRQQNLFRVEDNCNACKICQQICPVANITVTASPHYRGHCIECMACAHNCPQNAIRVKGEKNTMRYRHPQVSLKEIITANE